MPHDYIIEAYDNLSDLIYAKNNTPKLTNLFFNHLLDNLSKYIPFQIYLATAVNHFPDQSLELIDSILKKPEQFERLFSDIYDFIIVLSKFSAQEELVKKCIQFLLAEPAQFNRLFKKMDDFIFFISDVPQQTEILIQFLLATPAQFERLIPDINIFISTIKSLPNYSEILIQFLLTTPPQFERLVPDINIFISTIKSLPDYSEILMEFLFTTSTQFERLLPYDLRFNKLMRECKENRTAQSLLTYLHKIEESEKYTCAKKLAVIERQLFFAAPLTVTEWKKSLLDDKTYALKIN